MNFGQFVATCQFTYTPNTNFYHASTHVWIPYDQVQESVYGEDERTNIYRHFIAVTNPNLNEVLRNSKPILEAVDGQ